MKKIYSICALLLASVLSAGVVKAQDIPSIYDGCTPVKCTVNTLYSGQREITCVKLKDGRYALYDPEHKIFTVNSSAQIVNANGMTYAKQKNDGSYNSKNDYYSAVFNASDPITSESADWNIGECNYSFDGFLLTISGFNNFDDATAYIEVTEPGKDPYKTDAVSVEIEKDNVISIPSAITFDPNSAISVKVVVEAGGGSYSSESITLSQAANCRQQSEGLISSLPMTYKLYTIGTTTGLQPALDVHWGMEQIIDYYKTVFGYDSFDGKGTPLACFVNPIDELTPGFNARALQCDDPITMGYMTYGLGASMTMPGMGSLNFKPIVDLSVLGHEFTHLISKKFAENIDNMAFAESFADIMGLAIQNKMKGEKKWSFGEPISTTDSPLYRCFDNPTSKGYAECYKDDCYNAGEESQYIRSTVQTHMFYLLVEGGTGVNSLGKAYSVTPMDRSEADALAFQILTTHDFSELDYPALSKLWIETASEKYGESSSQVRSVIEAWQAVGLAEDVSAIDAVTANKSISNSALYNTLGQRISAPTKGIYIKNGKKIYSSK